jgi:hypothetical protein
LKEVLSKAMRNLMPKRNTIAREESRKSEISNPNSKLPFKTVHPHKLKTAVPLHPGFPQSGPIPSKPEWVAAKEARAARNEQNRDNAHRIRDEQLSRTKSYRDAAAQPANPQPNLQQQLILEVAKCQAMQTDHDKRLRQLEADVRVLRQALTPSRSAPLESVQQPVREIKPPRDTAPPTLPKLEPVKAPITYFSDVPKQPSGGASSSGTQQDLPTPGEEIAKPVDPKAKAPARPRKQLAPERPSTHNMSTRNKSKEAPVVTTVAPARTRPIVPDHWNDLKSQGGWVTVTHKKTRKGSAPTTANVVAMVVTTAMAGLPGAVAQTTSSPSHPMENHGVFWVQVVTALAIWVLFTFARHLARRSRKHTKMSQ